MARLSERLVELLLSGRRTPQCPRLGRLDTPAYTHLLLAAVAPPAGTAAGGMPPGAERPPAKVGVAASIARGAGRIARSPSLHMALSNAVLRLYGLLVPSDLAASTG